MGSKLATILMAEDEPADRLLAEVAFNKARIANPLAYVASGLELLEYLRGTGNFADRNKYPYPDLILLDLEMPDMDGRDALKAIKADESFVAIPIVVMSSSRSDQDVLSCYDLGAASFIPKPLDVDGLTKALKTIDNYWFGIMVKSKP